MNDPTIESWYIDALDARAGYAFASYRRSETPEVAPDLDMPGVFIAPPYFSPDVVGSRATALAAMQSSFQWGLYDRDGEVAFPSLESLTEFVRRSYVSGGAGDGNNEGGATPAAPPADDDGGDDSAISKIWREPPPGLDVLRNMALAVRDQGPASAGAAKETHAPSPEDVVREAADRRHDHYSLLQGATLLCCALLEQRPANQAQLASMLRGAAALGAALARFGLIDPLLTNKLFAEQIEAAVSRLLEASTLAELQSLTNSPLTTAFFYLFRLDFYRHKQFYMSHTASDPLDDLGRWPLPVGVSRTLSLDPTIANARDLLCKVVSNPTLLLHGDNLRENVASILLLCALHIVSANDHLSLLGRHGSPLSDVQHSDLIQQALVWLSRQMPRHVFTDDLEAVIQGMDNCRYARAMAMA